jgi:agmatinase
MRRVLEVCPAVQLGIRALDGEEISFARERGLPLFLDIDRRRDPAWMERALSHIRGAVYITVDLDALDPALLPAVGTPEPGGFGWYELLDVLRAIFERHPVVGVDVVELCPRPGLEASAFIAAKLVYKLIGYRFGLTDRRA